MTGSYLAYEPHVLLVMLFKCVAAGDGCSKFASNSFDDLCSFDWSVKIHTKEHVSATMQLSMLGNV